MSYTLPRPWRLAENEHNLECAPWRDAVAIEAEFDVLAVPSIVCWMTRPDGADNAALIVKAVNLHDDLVSVLRQMYDVHGGDGAWKAAAAVLAKVDA